MQGYLFSRPLDEDRFLGDDECGEDEQRGSGVGGLFAVGLGRGKQGSVPF